MSAQHTPGPWGVAEAAPDDKMMRVGSNLDPNTEITKNGGMWIAQVIGPDRIANARLIAAAPALLEALQDAKFRLFGAGPSADPLYATMRAAIAQATT